MNKRTSNKKLRFLIASGPTQEPLDPVRYISNYSTGTMGRHLVQAAKKRGHLVRWIECPQSAKTARDLLRKLQGFLPKSDVLIMAAAVCDTRPMSVSHQKLKKNKLSRLNLVQNPDVLANLAKKKRKEQIFIGFGLESKKLKENGLKKLKQKKLDFIVVQKVTKNQSPFGKNRVQAMIFDKKANLNRLGLVRKQKVAQILIHQAEQFSREKGTPTSRKVRD